MTGKKENKPEDLVVLTREEYQAIGREVFRRFLIIFRYQARCKCNIDFADLLHGDEYQ